MRFERVCPCRISQRSAEQRAGRAGRLGPGRVVRLWTRGEQDALIEEELPEIRRVDLASVVLELRAWGVADPLRFGWFEMPDEGALAAAEKLLASLGAIDGPGGALTETGRSLPAIPTHPRLARLVAAAHARGLACEGAGLAALLEERDLLQPVPFARERRSERTARSAGPSDLLPRLDLLEESERSGFRRDRLDALGVNAAAARAACRTRDLLLRAARDALGPEPAAPVGAGRDEALLRLLLLAYPDRVARRRARGSGRARMVGGRGVALAPESIVKDDELFLAIDVEDSARGERAEAMVRMASAVRREWILADYPHELSESVETFFDAETEKVRATATQCYRDLPLEEPRERRPPPAAAEEHLRRAARDRAEDLFLGDEEARAWILRVRSLRQWMPELELPAFDAAELAGAIGEACAGAMSFADLRVRGLLGILAGRLSHEKRQAIDRHAPSAIKIPTGREAPLQYEPGRPPVLAARIQELFGLDTTPRVAAGRVPVIVHLLAPNNRQVQITQDLESFWKTTYSQVRKDLRGRYPKHAWPEDPRGARPESWPSRKR